jgi:hypothetical protein
MDWSKVGAIFTIGCFVLAALTLAVMVKPWAWQWTWTRTPKNADVKSALSPKTWPIAVLIILGFIASGVTLWRTFSVTTEYNVQDRVMDWLKDSASSIREIPEADRPASAFAFDVILPSGKGITIERRKQAKHTITVSTSVTEAAEWQSLISAMPHDKFMATKTKVEMALAKTGFQYQMDLSRGYYLVLKDVSFDNLNYDTLMSTVGGEAEAITIVQGTLYLQLYPVKDITESKQP